MKKQVKIGLGAAALALAAALCAGGTLAGWRTSSTVTNHISTATVQGIVEEKYEQGQTITPGQTVEKCVWVKNTGTASSLVRAKVVIDWDDETAADMDATDCVFPAYNTADWTQGEDGYWYYNDIVEPNQCSTALFESFTVSPNLTNELAGRTGHIGVTMELLQASGDSPTLWGRTWSAYRRTPDAVAAKTQTAHIRFTYDENGGLIEYPDGQLFLDFQNLCPGETRSQLVAIDYTARNDSDAACSLWLRAALADNNKLGAETEEKIWKLLKQYAVITVTGPDSETLYSGPVWGNLDTDTNTMRNDLPLGRYSGTGTAHLNLTLTIDQNMPEELQGLLGYVDWTLTAAQESAPTVLVRYFPQTGIRKQICFARAGRPDFEKAKRHGRSVPIFRARFCTPLPVLPMAGCLASFPLSHSPPNSYLPAGRKVSLQGRRFLPSRFLYRSLSTAKALQKRHLNNESEAKP